MSNQQNDTTAAPAAAAGLATASEIPPRELLDKAKKLANECHRSYLRFRRLAMSLAPDSDLRAALSERYSEQVVELVAARSQEVSDSFVDAWFNLNLGITMAAEEAQEEEKKAQAGAADTKPKWIERCQSSCKLARDAHEFMVKTFDECEGCVVVRDAADELLKDGLSMKKEAVGREATRTRPNCPG